MGITLLFALNFQLVHSFFGVKIFFSNLFTNKIILESNYFWHGRNKNASVKIRWEMKQMNKKSNYKVKVKTDIAAWKVDITTIIQMLL
jgi:hypothetical protein